MSSNIQKAKFLLFSHQTFHQTGIVLRFHKTETDIISGVYQPGQRLPAVRELASCAAVNPNTMQRALSELERTGLVYSQRTSGRFITEDTAMIEGLKQQIAEEKIHDFFEAMKHLGISKEETLQLIQQHTTI